MMSVIVLAMPVIGNGVVASFNIDFMFLLSLLTFIISHNAPCKQNSTDSAGAPRAALPHARLLLRRLAGDISDPR
jgi:hypothetical protein